jgi:hypothetical protein
MCINFLKLFSVVVLKWVIILLLVYVYLWDKTSINKIIFVTIVCYAVNIHIVT